MSKISTFLKFSPNESVLDDWEVLDDPGDLHFGDLVGILFGLVFFLIPGILVLWEVISRPARKGYLCLTNWRLVYYERGEGGFRNHHWVVSFNLEDVLGVHCKFERGWFDTQTLFVRVHTRFEEGVIINIGQSASVLRYIPILGKLLQHRSMGKDAFLVPSSLFVRVQQRRRTLVDSGARF
jgi:hypothetical protein